ncbi:MAG: alanyl-tRNA editing protein [Terriglobales bacterium]
MTKRLYYHDTFLHEFEGNVISVNSGDKPTVTLDQTAFYPSSGGQVFDTGVLRGDSGEARVEQVEETENGEVVHYINPADVTNIRPGMKVRGVIDTFRRRDHMQQHSGQHVLSAAFERLYKVPTVSFHMGAQTSTIDLATGALTGDQLTKAEELANQIVFENRPVEIRFVELEEAKQLGLRKLPDVAQEKLRLIDIADFDLCACGGTHVQTTAQIGPIFIRKSERVKQGFRVEFVAGDRAIKTARHDFETLAQAAALFSSGLYDLPANIKKLLEEIKAAQKREHKLLEELAEFWAEKLLVAAESNGRFKVVKQVFPDRDLAFVKFTAQRLSKREGVVALLGTTQTQPALVFARSANVEVDVSALMKEVMAAVGGRGGGSKDLAQGGVPDAARVPELLGQIAAKLKP